jgi:hypothetical protein
MPLICPHCGADMRVIAFATEAGPVQRIVAQTGDPNEPAPISPVREPPGWDDDVGPIPAPPLGIRRRQ